MKKGPQQKNYEYISGPVVTELRRAKKWTQKQLAQLCMCSQGAISKIEAKPYLHVTTDLITAIARAFGVPVESLIDKEEEYD